MEEEQEEEEKRRRICENKKYVRVQTHMHILQHSSLYSIHLSISFLIHV